MSTVTLTTLRAQTRERADMVNSQFVTDTANSLDAMINAAAADLHDLLVRKFADNYMTKKANITTVANQNAYTLPTDFYHLLHIEILQGTKYYPLKRIELQNRNYYEHLSDWTYGTVEKPRYFLSGPTTIDLEPKPTTTGTTIRLWYAPVLAEMVAGSDTVAFPNKYEEHIVISAAIKCLNKEESDSTALQTELAQIEAKIDQDAENRNASSPQEAVDVDKQDILYLLGY